MTFKFLIKLFVSLLLCVLSFTNVHAAPFTELDKAEQLRIADLIFRNECNRKVECLVSWNEGENFASLGIGHFIWFPENSDAPFQESFPELLRWYEQRQVSIPSPLSSWVQVGKPCPWNNREQFHSAAAQADIGHLRAFLANTKDIQAGFIMERLSKALDRIVAAFPDKQQQQHIKVQFERVAASPSGWYLLADYVNFKGEGIKASERYHGQGWGLAQVLMNMQGTERGTAARAAFADAAAFVLERRVGISPEERNEERWLPGWKKRVATYLEN